MGALVAGPYPFRLIATALGRLHDASQLYLQSTFDPIGFLRICAATVMDRNDIFRNHC